MRLPGRLPEIFYAPASAPVGAAGLPTSREEAESLGLLRGGVSALRFDAEGNLVDAYPVQRNTTTNCSGGPTPWGTWVNGEEILDGFMFECSPLRDGGEPIRLDRFGRKAHEMAALDPGIEAARRWPVGFYE